MPALSETDQIEIITARTLARAAGREGLIDALALCESPALAGHDLAILSPDYLQAAALGIMQAKADYLCDLAERLGAELDAREAEAPAGDLGAAEVLCGDRNLCARPYRHEGDHESFAHKTWHQATADRTYRGDQFRDLDGNVHDKAAPAETWSMWRVSETEGIAREVGQLDREAAQIMAGQLNRDPRPAGVHFMALPLGGTPFDVPDAERYPAGVRS
jgi:hypothetical protein